ncbi:type 1 fimbrial protein [Cronobacter universalis]|nr:type 1 fimbrial protein [Cronobacter universalis]
MSDLHLSLFSTGSKDMKISCYCLAAAVGFLCMTAHAENAVKDISATLNITGTVEQSAPACSVLLSQNTLQVTENMSEVIDQGSSNYALTGGTITINATGGSPCVSLMDQGKMIYRFVGTADDAMGTVLANADRSATAAKGMGIGIYGMDSSPISVNTDTLTASSKGNHVNFTIVKLAGQNAVAGNIQTTVTVQIERL